MLLLPKIRHGTTAARNTIKSPSRIRHAQQKPQNRIRQLPAERFPRPFRTRFIGRHCVRTRACRFSAKRQGKCALFTAARCYAALMLPLSLLSLSSVCERLKLLPGTALWRWRWRRRRHRRRRLTTVAAGESRAHSHRTPCRANASVLCRAAAAAKTKTTTTTRNRCNAAAFVFCYFTRSLTLWLLYIRTMLMFLQSCDSYAFHENFNRYANLPASQCHGWSLHHRKIIATGYAVRLYNVELPVKSVKPVNLLCYQQIYFVLFRSKTISSHYAMTEMHSLIPYWLAESKAYHIR